MNEAELQDLSRRVAKMLPEDFCKYWQIDLLGRIRTHDSPVWLHDCTEACAEIEATLLVYVKFSRAAKAVIANRRTDDGGSMHLVQRFSDHEGNIMQAWSAIRLLATEIILKDQNNG